MKPGMDDERAARMVGDLGHVFGVQQSDVARWLASGLELPDFTRQRLEELAAAMDAAGEQTGTEATCEALRRARRADTVLTLDGTTPAPEPAPQPSGRHEALTLFDSEPQIVGQQWLDI